MVPQRCVSISQTPTCTALPNPAETKKHTHLTVMYSQNVGNIYINSSSYSECVLCVCVITDHWGPVLWSGVWGGSLWLSHSPAAVCMCCPGCSRPEPPQRDPLTASPAAVSSWQTHRQPGCKSCSEASVFASSSLHQRPSFSRIQEHYMHWSKHHVIHKWSLLVQQFVFQQKMIM